MVDNSSKIVARRELLNQLLFDTIELSDVNSMNNWLDYGIIEKDVYDGQLFKVKGITKCINGKFNIECSNGLSVPCTLKKEKKFFNLNGINYDNLDEIEEWINSDGSVEWFRLNEIHILISILNNVITGSLSQAYYSNKRFEFMDQIKNSNDIYIAKIKERNHGGFLVSINGIDAFLPGSLAAANKIIDFNDLIGKEIPVMFEDYLKEGDTFIVSNKKYIQHILPKKIEELDKTVQYSGEVTGTISFGIFIEFNDIMTGLLHVSEMNPETLNTFRNNNFKPGSKIQFYIKEVKKDNKIILSEKETLEEVSMEDFRVCCETSIQPGEVMSIKPIGVFVKFNFKENSFMGLLHKNNFRDDINLRIGEEAEFYISKVDCETKKIFLKLPYYNRSRE